MIFLLYRHRHDGGGVALAVGGAVLKFSFHTRRDDDGVNVTRRIRAAASMGMGEGVFR